jgi:hypothetical protein
MMKEDFRLFESTHSTSRNLIPQLKTQSVRTVQPEEQSMANFKLMIGEILQNKMDFEHKLDKIKSVLTYFEKKQFENNVELLLKLFIHEVSYLKNMEYDLNRVIAVI